MAKRIEKLKAKNEELDAKADWALGGIVSALLKVMASPWTAWILFAAAVGGLIVMALVLGSLAA